MRSGDCRGGTAAYCEVAGLLESTDLLADLFGAEEPSAEARRRSRDLGGEDLGVFGKGLELQRIAGRVG